MTHVWGRSFHILMTEEQCAEVSDSVLSELRFEYVLNDVLRINEESFLIYIYTCNAFMYFMHNMSVQCPLLILRL